jgi:hypothetical protein
LIVNNHFLLLPAWASTQVQVLRRQAMTKLRTQVRQLMFLEGQATSSNVAGCARERNLIPKKGFLECPKLGSYLNFGHYVGGRKSFLEKQDALGAVLGAEDGA